MLLLESGPNQKTPCGIHVGLCPSLGRRLILVLVLMGVPTAPCLAPDLICETLPGPTTYLHL